MLVSQNNFPDPRDGSVGKGAWHLPDHLSSSPINHIVERISLSFDLHASIIPVDWARSSWTHQGKYSMFISLGFHQDIKFRSKDPSCTDVLILQRAPEETVAHCRVSIFQRTRHGTEVQRPDNSSIISHRWLFSLRSLCSCLLHTPPKAAITRGSEMECQQRSNLPLRI